MRDILLGFNQIFIIATDFHRSHQYQILRKSDKWEPRWYIRTDMTKLISSFRDYKNTPENHKFSFQKPNSEIVVVSSCLLGHYCFSPGISSHSSNRNYIDYIDVLGNRMMKTRVTYHPLK